MLLVVVPALCRPRGAVRGRALARIAFAAGEAFWAQDLPFFMERHGYLEARSS
ncbi:hypothetical protein [Ramlibacter algicola]|uniref:Uncharacterized protein n=1 Tax=Ramlibacter algicola TaxID=2795217 RepID=A0A934Q397_9BURK|nr:hypothetical protein [Ramlibacter algicola]MBK0394053.1 hypothetical protein [Ramlibacter algicola]